MIAKVNINFKISRIFMPISLIGPAYPDVGDAIKRNRPIGPLDLTLVPDLSIVASENGALYVIDVTLKTRLIH